MHIIEDLNVNEWDYNKWFQDYGINLKNEENENSQEVCDIINEVLDVNIIYGSENRNVKSVFSGEGGFDQNNMDNETLRKAEGILKYGGEEKTELARIISQKYERMSRYEY